MNLTNVSEIPVLNSHQNCVLLNKLSFVYQQIYYLLPGSCTVDIWWKMNLLYVALGTSTTFLPRLGTLIPYPINILKDCNTIDNKYSAVAHLEWSAQPFLFYHIELKPETRSYLFSTAPLFILYLHLLWLQFFLLWSDKKEWNTLWRVRLCIINDEVSWYLALKCSNEIPLIYIYILPP